MSNAQEVNKAAFRRTYDEMFNRGELSVADELVAPDFINHEVPPGHDNCGPESLRQVVLMLRRAFPDLSFEILELVAEGDWVAGRLVMRGTHQGPLMGMAPTGRTVEQAHAHFVRFQDGRAVEQYGIRDDMSMRQQLGVMAAAHHL